MAVKDTMQALRVDFHVHTEASEDGLSSLNEIADAAKAAGIAAVAIADHNAFTLSKQENRQGVLFLPACEFSTDKGHVLALFCKETFVLERVSQGALPTAETVIKAIHAHGGLAVMAHPFEKAQRNLAGLENLLDGVETENSRAWMRNPQANVMAKVFCEQFFLKSFGGSDAHEAKAVGNAYTLVETGTVGGLEQAVREGRCTAVSVRQTKRIQKARSQLKKAKGSGSPYLLLRGVAYYGYSFLRDIFKF